jgi:hypothetical protein
VTLERQQIYLGDWRSHPARVGERSGRDRQMILNNWRDAKMEIDFVLAVNVITLVRWIEEVSGN